MPSNSSTIVRRVATRHLQSLDLGRDHFTDKGLKFHHWHGSLSITDLTNAGKRGKKVRELWLKPNTQNDEFAERIIKQAVDATSHMSYDQAKVHLEKVRAEFSGKEGKVPLFDLREEVHRGVDVEPMGTKINLENKFPDGSIVRIEASPHDFLVVSSTPIHAPDKPAHGLMQDTRYWPRNKPSGIAFYGWIKDNMSKAAKMKVQDLITVWGDLGVKWDSH